VVPNALPIAPARAWRQGRRHAAARRPPISAVAPVVTETSWQIFRTPGAAWDAMIEDCRRARRSIDFEQYIVEDDAVGRRFLELFRERARRGVRVRALCDMVGSLGLYGALWGDHLDSDGPAIRFYNPVSPWRINRVFSWSRRDHRKLLVVDSEVGHVGGVCVAERMRGWRDTQVRVRGPVVAGMARAFDELWRSLDGRRSGPATAAAPADGSAPFRLVTNGPHPHRNLLYRELLGRVRGARAYIFLTTPYFLPNPAFFRALRRAAGRGVEVGLLLPEHNDVTLVKEVSESYFPGALGSGIRIFLYGSTVLHAKSAVIDDAWATVGSANLDYLSFFGNHEANLVATEPAFVAALKRDFLADLEGAREVEPSEWRRGWHPVATLIGRAGRLVRALL
jgi:cardiolipin synthase A/B